MSIDEADLHTRRVFLHCKIPWSPPGAKSTARKQVLRRRLWSFAGRRLPELHLVPFRIDDPSKLSVL
jgi:hypothetical protein